MSVAPFLSTSAQILHSGGLVSLQHHSRSAVSIQLYTKHQ